MKSLEDDNTSGKCPVVGHTTKQSVSSTANQRWWPNQLSLKPLRQHSTTSTPMSDNFDYAKEFESLDIEQLCGDIDALMTDSQDWWPADYGHYGPFFIRMAWHSAGTYRIGDGRGGAGAGNLRFAPLNSWPDNVNLDKARQLLWPIKKKYGKKISWADLMILTGNRALETMGFKTMGFAGGREDIWEPEEDTYWGPEDEWLTSSRYSGDRQLDGDLGAVQMGLIYVNPEGPDGDPDPLASARDIRETFARMAMNDEETVALIAGGHTFGKAHGAADPDLYVAAEPEGASLEEQGLGWKSSFESGKGEHTISSGLEGAWTDNPIQWDNNYFANLFGYDWVKTKSPAGATQWMPKNGALKDAVPDAHIPDKKHAPVMFTSDLALKEDPVYRVISKRFHENPEQFAQTFAKAWYKLTHRDMGPFTRGLGSLVPSSAELWQDPIPEVNFKTISEQDTEQLKEQILSSGLSISQLVSTAWASASTFRNSDKRGGANGARIQLEPQRNWGANNPSTLNSVLNKLVDIQTEFNQFQTEDKKVSLADLIVLGGTAAVQEAASLAGQKIVVPFMAGRNDTTQELTDIESYAALKPRADGFTNFRGESLTRSSAELLVDQSSLLTLTPSEMTVFVGGMRVLSTNFDQSTKGVFTDSPETLTNDFFVNLLDPDIEWKAVSRFKYEGTDKTTKEVKWVASDLDLLFGSNSELRALAEFYACDDSKAIFAGEFSKVWVKLMNLDRFELC